MAWSRGNLAHPLIDGAEYFRRLSSELADTHAGDEVYLAAWIGDPTERLDGPGSCAGAQFARALRSGVSVYGLFWCPYLTAAKDFVRDNRSFVALLQRLGGFAVLDQRVRAVGSHHQKYVVIRRPERPGTDIAFLGGIDPYASRGDAPAHRGDPQVQSSLAAVYGKYPAWHDAHLELRGPAVADVEYCFRERWNDATSLRRTPFGWSYGKFRAHERRTAPLPAQLPPPPRRGSHTVQLLRTYPKKSPAYPFAPDGERSVARGYVKALQNARKFIYVEDQFLWSPMVAEVFARVLRREPELRMVAVLPSRPDKDGVVQVATSDVAHDKALSLLYAAGGDRIEVYELENTECMPIYVHAKVCIVDDVWATVGSANLNRRSWTYDTELTAAIMDEGHGGGSSHAFATDLRLRLWREHLGREAGEDGDLLDPECAIAALRESAAVLERWHGTGRCGPRPRGHLRGHPRPTISTATRAWAVPTGRVVTDPDGRPQGLRDAKSW